MRKFGILIFSLISVIFMSAFIENQKVYDNAKLLTDEQIQTLQQKCIDIANQNEIDIIIMTVNDTSDKTVQQYADDFYDENAFGYEYEHGTGILLLVDMGSRNVWISTSGNAIEYFTDEMIDIIVNDIALKLKSGEYYSAFTSFLDSVSNYQNSKSEATPDSAQDIYESSNSNIYLEQPSKTNHTEYILMYLAVSIVVGVVGAALAVYSSSGKSKANSMTYLDKSSVNMKKSHEQYIRTSVITRTINRNDNNTGAGGSGGSSTHTSSSGYTHGGGGGSF